MTIRMHPMNFKIRSKADAERFLNQIEDGRFYNGSGEWYWHSNTMDYCLNVKARRVTGRLMCERGNIFSPFCEVRDPLHTIWVTRKFINAQLFAE